jgi:hypothetical protein
MRKASVIESEQLDDELIPCVVHPLAKARMAGHLAICEVILTVAKDAASDAGVELVRIRIFPDCSHEFDASQMLVFEAVLRASHSGYDPY